MRILLALLTSLFAAAALLPSSALATGQSGSTRTPTASDGPDVVLYVLPNCGYCEKARQLLTRHGVTWREVDIDSSSDGKKRFVELGGVGTPLLVIGDDTLHGFDSHRIESLLAQHGLVAR